MSPPAVQCPLPNYAGPLGQRGTLGIRRGPQVPLKAFRNGLNTLVAGVKPEDDGKVRACACACACACVRDHKGRKLCLCAVVLVERPCYLWLYVRACCPIGAEAVGTDMRPPHPEEGMPLKHAALFSLVFAWQANPDDAPVVPLCIWDPAEQDPEGPLMKALLAKQAKLSGGGSSSAATAATAATGGDGGEAATGDAAAAAVPAVEAAAVASAAAGPKHGGLTALWAAPFLARKLRPHQREGVKFMVQCIAGEEAAGGADAADGHPPDGLLACDLGPMALT